MGIWPMKGGQGGCTCNRAKDKEMGKIITHFDKAAIEEAGQALNDKQRTFVHNLFVPGTTNQEAAVLAGYAEASAHVTASRLLRFPNIMEYIDACVKHGSKLQAIKAQIVVGDLLDSTKSDYVKLQAAQDILDRAGHKPVEKKAHAVVGQLNVSIDLGD